jgi:hypothetical protein
MLIKKEQTIIQKQDQLLCNWYIGKPPGVALLQVLQRNRPLFPELVHTVSVKITDKDKSFPCAVSTTPWRRIGEVEVQLHTFLTLAYDGGEWSASCPGHFTPRERVPGTRWIGGWEGPRASLDMVVMRKIPSPCQDSNPDHPACSPVLYHWTNPALVKITEANETFSNCLICQN